MKKEAMKKNKIRDVYTVNKFIDFFAPIKGY